jgi:NAD(P)-dependent dehydrogenase (short-subunit alcohol dehydrogenase family)
MIVITGASRGIGHFLFNEFEREGHETVVGTYHNTIPVGGSNRYYQVDVTKEDEVGKFAKHCSEGREIKLVHCAGVTSNAYLGNTELVDWEKVLAVNTTSAFLLCREFLPAMRRQKYGRIVFFSSVVPQLGVAGTSAYAASKAALWGLAKTIAKENALENITCNTLNLGYFNAGMINEIPEPHLPHIINSIPMKKLGAPINICYALRFLFLSDYTTGCQININGGLV